MRKLLFLIFFILFSTLYAQKPEKLNSSEIFNQIQQLNFLGSVLYVAAHPDDENTSLITYLSNSLNARTAYLSLTRGDGGQNLIGPQLRELLGVIRTQELLAARKIDGGKQFFTRANDFGYSKTPEETLRIWNKDEVLSDVVRIIRKFRPDIIITRFNENSAGETHGHHTASAILANKGFYMAGDSSAFSSQINELQPWDPKKLYFNTSPWFYPNKESFKAANKSGFVKINTGVYYPLRGLSNTEISALSRSKHQSQGFGTTGTRGRQIEYLKPVAGIAPENEDSLFAGINTSWSRIKGGRAIGDILNKVEKNFSFKNPAASIPALVEAYQLIEELENEHWRKIKAEAIKKIIAASAGLYLEAVAEEAMAIPGEEVSISLEAINRSKIPMELVSAEILPVKQEIEFQTKLKNNISWKEQLNFMIPEEQKYTSPYWLKEKGSLGMYKVKDKSLIGLPETPNPFKVNFLVEISGEQIPFQRNIIYKNNNPVLGEVYQPFEVAPKISLSIEDKVAIFNNKNPKTIAVTLTALKDNLQGKLRLQHEKTWQVSPASVPFNLVEKGQKKTFLFSVTPPKNQAESVLKPVATINEEAFSDEIVQIDYSHIPLQTIILPSEVKAVKLDIKKQGNLIGYIAGAGDAVPEALRQIGYEVVMINPDAITATYLEKFDAVVTGIRAYNVVPELQFKQKALLEYIEHGGNLIIQYNTNRGLVTENLAPYPLKISRDRVTDENAEVDFLAPGHPVLNVPNKITKKDFQDWVQERGLYFPDEWTSEYTPVVAMKDQGEKLKKGSILIAPYGKGNYIYTGLSFFRQFPAAVPGAFRLFANMLSLGSKSN